MCTCIVLSLTLSSLSPPTLSSAKADSSSADFVYYSTASSSSTHYPLYRMDMYTKEEVVIDSKAYRFRVDSKYLFVSRKNVTGDKASDEKSRRLYVSQTYALKNVEFEEVQLPSLSDQQVWFKAYTSMKVLFYLSFPACCSSMSSWQLMRWVHSFMCMMGKVSYLVDLYEV